MRKIDPKEKLRLQVASYASIADIGSNLSEAVSSNHLLSLILKETLDLMDAEVCIIWLKEKDRDLAPIMSFGLKSGIIDKIKMKDDLFPRQLTEEEGLKSILSAPLVAAGQKIGILTVAARSKREYSEVDTKVFNALARQAALAIQDVGLYDKMGKKVEEKSKEIAVLFDMSRSISSSGEKIKTALNSILEKTCLLMNAKFCTLRHLGISKRRSLLVASAHIDNDTLRQFSRFESRVSKGVINSGEPLIINNVKEHFRKKIPACLKDHDINAILIVPLFSKLRKVGALSVYLSDRRSFQKDDVALISMIGDISSMAIDNTTMLDRIKKDYLHTIKMLAKVIDETDKYTRGHCNKVMKYSLRICKRLGLPGRYTNSVKIASLLHDIGKIGVDLSLIRKQEELTDDDWRSVRRHPEIGANIIKQVGFLSDIVPIVKYHHARFEGGGYPDPEKTGNDIPLGARILAVADAFDAMTSDRPYRIAMTRSEAKKELERCSGSQFDPDMVNVFLK